MTAFYFFRKKHVMNRKLTNDIMTYLRKFSLKGEEIIEIAQKLRNTSHISCEVYKEETSKYYIVSYDLRTKMKLKEYLLKSFPNCEIFDQYQSIKDVENILRNINDHNIKNKIIFLDDNPNEHDGCETEDEKYFKEANDTLFNYLKTEFKYVADLYFSMNVRMFLGGRKEIFNDRGGMVRIHHLEEYAHHTINYYYNLVEQIFPDIKTFSRKIRAMVLPAPKNYEFYSYCKNALKSKFNNIEVFDRGDPYIYSLSFIDDFTIDDYVIVDGESLDQFIYLAKIMKIGINCTILLSNKTIYSFVKAVVQTYNLNIKIVLLNSFPSSFFTYGEDIFDFDAFIGYAKILFNYFLPDYVEDQRKIRLSPLANEAYFVSIPILLKTLEYAEEPENNIKDSLKILKLNENRLGKNTSNLTAISRLTKNANDKNDIFNILVEMMFYSYNSYAKGIKIDYQDMLDKVKLYKENKDENRLYYYLSYCSLVLAFLLSFSKN